MLQFPLTMFNTFLGHFFQNAAVKRITYDCELAFFLNTQSGVHYCQVLILTFLYVQQLTTGT